MIKNLRRKGFTIVELVIVIAVIAILAAILIPTFSGIIKKANIANDTALAKNMNTALIMAESEGVEVEDMSDVLVIVNEAGYVVENLNPTTNGYYFVWDSESNQILFLDDTLNIHYKSKQEVGAKVNWWTTVGSAKEAEFIGNEGISIYFENNIDANITLTKLVSVDTGFYSHSGKLSIIDNAASYTTVLSGVFGTLEITAPKASILQTGYIAIAIIKDIAETSFDVYGFIDTLTLLKGHVHSIGGVINNLNGETGGLKKFTNNGAPLASDKITGEVLVVTNANPVLSISNATELQNFAYAVNNGADYSGVVVEITKNIDFSNRTWTPIGNTLKKAFSGTIDGKGHQIYGLSNNGYVGGSSFVSSLGTSGNTFGLIGFAKGHVTIKDLNLNININGEKNNLVGAAGLIGIYDNRGQNDYASKPIDLPNFKYDYTVNITNVVINGSFSGNDKVGGFIGSAYISPSTVLYDDDKPKNVSVIFIFSNCVNNANISYASPNSAAGFRAGGFIGTLGAQLQGLKLIGCINNGLVIPKTATGLVKTGNFIGYITAKPNYDFPSITVAAGDYME